MRSPARLAAEPPSRGANRADRARAPTGEIGRIARWLRARLAGRPDSEHEQALIRLVIFALAFVFVMLVPPDPTSDATVLALAIPLYLAVTAAALAILGHILLRPDANPVRRVLGMLIDNIACNGVMLIGGPSAMVFFPLLLWTILGHGFRFGRGYLVGAAATAIVCFGAVVRFGPGWESVPYLDVGLLFSLILLPAYFWILLGKLTDAVSRAEEASRAKSQFLATMSYEFRTPLNAVIGMSDLLRTTSLDAEQRGMVGTIRGAAGSLLALVNDLLDIASIEARRLTVEPVPFSLARELAGLRAMLHPQVRDKGLYLRLRWHPDTPSDLIGAAEPLRRILLNLTANAIRFTARGGVVIEVVPLELTPVQVRLRLVVRDTGIGIPAERQKEIFERFTQADTETRRRFGGTGLGLAIARDLATLMGGRIGVSSTPDEGSAFWVELPFARADRPADPPGDPREGSVIVAGGGDALLCRLQRLGFLALPARGVEGVGRRLRSTTGRVAILLGPDGMDIEPAELAARLAADGGAGPVDILTLGDGWSPSPDVTLADLPAAIDDQRLAACLAAALARQEQTPPAEAAEGAAAFRARRPGRILLAEDIRTNQQVIGAILGRAGHEVVIVASGDEVLERLETERFDLVLTDINMPGMSGFELIKLLRFAHPASTLPPIVALSADATREARATAEDLGFSGYMTKPVDAVALVEALDDLMVPATKPLAAAPRAIPPIGADAGTALTLDRSKLDALRRLDDDGTFVVGLMRDFVADAEELTERLDVAVAEDDVRSFRDLAHALRSSAAHLGAQALVERTLAWRQLDAAALASRGPEEMAALRRVLAELRAALDAYRAELVASPSDTARD